MDKEQEQVELGTALAEREDAGVPEQVANGAAVGMDEGNELIRFALDKGADVEVLERLVALQERVADRHAEMAMAQALAAFQAECPPVPRTATGHQQNKFAPLDEIARTIRPHLANHGLSYTHDSAVDGSQIEVTCTLRHVDGATRTAKFRGPFDNSGGKNALQAVGSSRTYGKRYTLTDVTGISTEDDDDGAGAGTPHERITDKQLADMEALIEEVGASRDGFVKWLEKKINRDLGGLADLPAKDYRDAVRALEQKRNES